MHGLALALLAGPWAQGVACLALLVLPWVRGFACLAFAELPWWVFVGHRATRRYLLALAVSMLHLAAIGPLVQRQTLRERQCRFGFLHRMLRIPQLHG